MSCMQAVTNFPIHEYMDEQVSEDVSPSSQISSELADNSEVAAQQQRLCPPRRLLIPDSPDLSGWSATSVQPIMADRISSETCIKPLARNVEAQCPPLYYDGLPDEEWQQLLGNVVSPRKPACEKETDTAVDEVSAHSSHKRLSKHRGLLIAALLQCAALRLSSIFICILSKCPYSGSAFFASK